MIEKLLGSYLDLPRTLRIFLLLACLLTIASLGSALIWRSTGFGLPYSAPYYFVPEDLFQDFQSFRPRFGAFGTPDFFIKPPGQYLMYPAPLIFPIAFFMHFSHPIRSFLTFTVLVVVLFALLLRKTLIAAGINPRSASVFTFVTLLTSYPVLFLIQRGNLEVLVWIPVTLGLLFFYRKQYMWAAIAFGVATSLKLYPFMFLSLLISKRRFRETCVALLTAAGVTLVALWRLGPTIPAAFAWNSIQLQAFGKYFAASEWALGYDHSFFALVKVATLHWHPDLTPYVHAYTLAAAVLGLFLFFAFLWRIPTLNQILVLSVLSITMPPVSYDYTLLSLYAVFAMLCVAAVKAEELEINPKIITCHLVLFALVLTPESYLIFGGARFCAQFRCLCMIVSIALALRFPLPEPEVLGRVTNMQVRVSRRGN